MKPTGVYGIEEDRIWFEYQDASGKKYYRIYIIEHEYLVDDNGKVIEDD